MIEVYVPFLLLMMSWNTVDPSGTMVISQRLFLDEATCRAAGEEAERGVGSTQHAQGQTFLWRCVEEITAIEVSTQGSSRP